MRAVLALAMLLAVAPVAAAAQALRVQSGDHADFTRLVLTIGAERAWDLRPTGDRRWTLSVTPAAEGFETARVFDLIRRNRLADLLVAEDLTLVLACACDVTGARHQGQYLVIDILDPDPDAVTDPVPAGALAAVPEDASGPASAEAAARRAAAAEALPNLSALLTAPAAMPIIARRPVADAAPSGAPAPVAEAAPDTAPDASPDAAPVDAAAPNPRLAEAAEIMAEQLARAAAAGLLDAALDQPMTIGDPTGARPVADAGAEVASGEPDAAPLTPAPSPAPAPASAFSSAPAPASAPDIAGIPTGFPPGIPTGFPPGALPIHAQNAHDLALRLDLPIGREHPPGACTGTAIDVRDWSDGHGLDQGLGALRLALYDERDALVAEGALALARHYLHHGFGAEAAYWLRQLPEPPLDLLQIAAVVDGDPATGFPAVEAPSECTPGELLWRYLAGAVPAVLGEGDVAGLQRAYGELPPVLRDLLGPRLATRLMEDGQAAAAMNVRDALHRGGRIDANALTVLDLSLGLRPDAPAAATRAAFDAALQRDGGDPAAIMAQALAFDRETGQMPDPGRITAGEALLRETPPGPLSDPLWMEVLLAQAAIGEIDAALRMLDDPDRGAETHAAALTALIRDRVAASDTAALLILAHSHGAGWRPQGSEAGRAQVAAISALRAEGLFAAANILRDVRRPLVLPAPEPAPATPETEAALAWQDGDWDRLGTLGSGPHAEVARRMAGLEVTPTAAPDAAADATPAGTPAGSPAVPDLAALSATLADSRTLRATIADLLARPALP